jgi:lipopolysaccharide exporter
VPFVQVLSLIYGISAVSHASGYLLLTLGKIRHMAIFIWVQVAIFALGVFTVFLDASPIVIAQWRLVVTACSVFGFISMVLMNVKTLSAKDIVNAAWRPPLAVAMMAGLLWLMPWHGLSPVASLVLQCGLGGLSYTVFLAILWFVSGRPDGGEAYILRKLMPLLRRST